MPVYTVDNPSCSLAVAKERVRGILGENLVSVTSITPKNASRVSVETKTAIDSSKIAIVLGRIPKREAEETVEPVVQSDAPPVDAPPVVTAPAEPAPAEPVAAEPVAAEPVAAEPVAAEPAPAEPVTPTISPL